MYYLALNGQKAGPFTFEQVQEMWRAGTAGGQTLFWKDGQADWQPLANIASSFAGAPAASSPAPASPLPSPAGTPDQPAELSPYNMASSSLPATGPAATANLPAASPLLAGSGLPPASGLPAGAQIPASGLPQGGGYPPAGAQPAGYYPQAGGAYPQGGYPQQGGYQPQGGYPPQPGYPGGPYQYPGAYQRTSTPAVVSLVLSIIGLFTWYLFVFPVAAVILGHMGLNQVKRGGGQVTGRGMAIAGLIMGYLALLGFFGMLAIYYSQHPEAHTRYDPR